MIIKSLYLYYTNSDYLWKTEKFFLFLLVTGLSSIATFAMTYWGFYLFSPYGKPECIFFSFLTSISLIVYNIWRWCHYIALETKGLMDKRGNIKKPLSKKDKERIQKEQDRESTLQFAKDLK